MAILNYTTQVDAGKTVSEIQKELGSAGAIRIQMDYENGQPVLISFQVIYNGTPLNFRLPANYQAVLRILIKQKVPLKLRTTDQAIRVTWRIIKVWIDAQLAIIESAQADLATVFLPYGVTQNNKTVREILLLNPEQLLLTN